MGVDESSSQGPPGPPKLGPEGLFASSGAALDRALALVEFLRANCPWDRKQTPETLVPHLLEETHETVDAIHAGDATALKDELGDLLLNLAFQVVLAEETGGFDREDVVRGLEQKMVRRHPHLFEGGDPTPWESIKAGEASSGALAGLPSGIDPLLRAHRMQEKAAGVGFDWDEAMGALAKVREELDEVSEALASEGPEAIDEEIGDLLFSVVNLARLAGAHALTSLARANRKFEARFRALETLARERGLALPGASLDELDALWDEVKRR